MNFLIIFNSKPPIYVSSYSLDIFQPENSTKYVINLATHMYTKDGKNWNSILLTQL